jgi:hypothetical protein
VLVVLELHHQFLVHLLLMLAEAEAVIMATPEGQVELVVAEQEQVVVLGRMELQILAAVVAEVHQATKEVELGVLDL